MDISKTDKIRKFSNPEKVIQKAKHYGVKVYRSTRPTKKYMIYHNKWVHFGAMGYEDYTKHKNKTRRRNYLQRSAGIHDSGKYSANELSRHILW
jgi:hypothetical protein